MVSLLVLFVVIAAGYALGQIRVLGFNLGIAGVLFAGLLLGGWQPQLALPEAIQMLGLVLLVYTIGLASGMDFLAALRSRGLGFLGLSALAVSVAGLASWGLGRWLGIDGPLLAGLYAGALTNTPALAGVIAALPPDQAAIPAVGYAVAYPFGVIGMMLAYTWMERRWTPDYQEEALEAGLVQGELATQLFAIQNPAVIGKTVATIQGEHQLKAIFGRLERDGEVYVIRGETELKLGDLVSVIGPAAEVAQAGTVLGSAAGRLTYQQGGVDLKWAMVSNRELAGRRLSELEFPQRFGVVITRIERQGLERVPNGQSRLELGDRMALLGQEAQVMALAHELDSSPSTAAEVDLLSFSLGIALGLLLGMIVLPLPGGVSFSLGIAGGPLVVGLVLGIVGRSGPLLWLIPHGANLSLRQLGLALFLAGVGTRSGAAFFAGISGGEGLGLLTLGAAITLLAATVILLPGYIWLKIPLGTLGGVLAGTQTQPALLGFLRERTTSALPALSYVTVFPVATLLKIVMAQVLLWL